MFPKEQRSKWVPRQVYFGYPGHLAKAIGIQAKCGFSSANQIRWYDSSETSGIPRGREWTKDAIAIVIC
jgi:hypothetical protein